MRDTVKMQYPSFAEKKQYKLSISSKKLNKSGEAAVRIALYIEALIVY